MAVDPSIPLGAQTPKISLAETLGTAGNIIGLQSQRQQLQANQILTKAYADSTDPQTGQVDFNKLQAEAAKGGAGAFLPDFMGKIATQRNQQQVYDTSKLDMALKQQQNIRSMIGSLMADPGLGQTDMSKQIVGQITSAVQAGTLPADQALQEARSIPQDPQAQAAWVKNHFMNALDGEAKLKALMPQVQVINSGGQQNIVAIDPLTGQPRATGVLQNTLDPATATSPVQTVGPDGTPMAVTRQQFAGMADGGATGGYNGRYPGAQTVGTGDGMPAGQYSGGTGVPTGMSPAAQAAATAGASTAAKGAADAAQTLHIQAADAPVRVGYLRDAATALDNIKTGPGTDWRNSLASGLQSSPGLGAILEAAGVTDPSKIASYDEFKKIMVNYANGVSSSSGTGTDSRLNAAITGNANPNISKLANQDIMVKAIAAEQYRAAQDLAFQNSGVPPQKFNQWQAQWNKNVDPAAFAYTEMNADQQAAFRSRLQKQGKLDSFKNSFNTLVNSGIIPPPGGQ